MPWHEFVPVKRAQYDPAAEPLEPAKVIGLGLVLSRFDYNGLPNQRFTPGNFKLQVRVLTLCSAELPAAQYAHAATGRALLAASHLWAAAWLLCSPQPASSCVGPICALGWP